MRLSDPLTKAVTKRFARMEVNRRNAERRRGTRRLHRTAKALLEYLEGEKTEEDPKLEYERMLRGIARTEPPEPSPYRPQPGTRYCPQFETNHPHPASIP